MASSIEQQPASKSDEMRERIDAALGRYALFDEDCPKQLADAICYSLLSPGKRLRPRLVLMAAEACGGSFEDAMPAACAMEMIHAYSLVHDDLPAMDDDDLRRGRATCHKQFNEAVAILVGDALQARAFELLATEIKPASIAAKCCAVLGRAAGASALVGGQADDLAMAEKSVGELNNSNLTDLESIHRRKTGALFVAALELGGIVANAGSEQLAALDAYGRNVGLAFQITDDLLDVSGNEASVGKRVAKDASHGKLTFPRLMGIDSSRQNARQLVEEACAMIEVFGPKAEPLQSLAQSVLTRKN